MIISMSYFQVSPEIVVLGRVVIEKARSRKNGKMVLEDTTFSLWAAHIYHSFPVYTAKQPGSSAKTNDFQRTAMVNMD